MEGPRFGPYTPKLQRCERVAVGQLVRHVRMGEKIAQKIRQVPHLEISAVVQPVTRQILRVQLTLTRVGLYRRFFGLWFHVLRLRFLLP